MAEGEKGLRYIQKNGHMAEACDYGIGMKLRDDDGKHWEVQKVDEKHMWFLHFDAVSLSVKQEVVFTTMPTVEIKAGHTYLLGVDPDIWRGAETARKLLEELEGNFPGTKFVFAAGLYSVSEKPNGD